SSFAAYWVAARAAFAISDPLDLARIETERLFRMTRKMLRLGEDLARSTMSATLPAEAAHRVISDQQVNLAAGPVRMMTSAARRMFARGAVDEGFMFFEGSIRSFHAILDETSGAIGDYNTFAH